MRRIRQCLGLHREDYEDDIRLGMSEPEKGIREAVSVKYNLKENKEFRLCLVGFGF